MAKRNGQLNKTEIIKAYLVENPTATWGTAEKDMKKYGISGSYFSMVKSKMKKKGRKGPKSRGRRIQLIAKAVEAMRPVMPSAEPTLHQMEAAAQFAKAAGGLDAAKVAMERLKSLQV